MKENMYNPDRYNGLMSEYYVKMLNGTLSFKELGELKSLSQRRAGLIEKSLEETVNKGE